MFLRRNTLRTIAGAVAFGLLIFLALYTPLPPFAAKPLQGLSRFFKSLVVAGAKLRGLRVGSAAVVGSEERTQLMVHLARLRALEQENEALKRALGMGEDLRLRVIPAATLGFLREGRDEFILISRGRADGLHEGALVLDGGKVLVGSVVSAEARVAKVKLLTSSSSALEVVIEPVSSERGSVQPLKALARGANIRELEIDLVPQGAAVRKGDLVFAARNTLPGRQEPLLVGEVREVRKAEDQVFTPIRAVHLFDPFTAETVFVIQPA